MTPRPPRSTLFPYTTLFRSTVVPADASANLQIKLADLAIKPAQPYLDHWTTLKLVDGRSEEHTSELQSHVNLVCRLLLEKKKKTSHKSCTLYIMPSTKAR